MTGRNEKCPCGSGKKYKKCCLVDNQPDASEFKRKRLGEIQSGLIKKLGRHASEIYGPDAIHDAFEEFHLWEHEDGFDPGSNELPLFMPFYYYQWFPDVDSSICEGAPLMPPALSLAETDKSLTPEQRRYLIECCETGFSFYEVLEVIRGNSLDLKDLLTEEEHHVIEKSATEGVRPGDLIFGKVINIEGIGVLEACAPFIIPPQTKIEVLDLRKRLKKQNKFITNEILNDFNIEILELYRKIYDQITNPPQRIMTNTDGHLFIPHKMIFHIDDSTAMFEALHSLDFNDSKEDLLIDSKIDNATGKIKLVEFPWLHKGNKKYKEWENTVWGHIKIELNKMTVEVNSKERAKKFQTELKKRIKAGWKLKTTVIEPIEAKLKEVGTKPPTQKQLASQRESEKLMKHPEMIAHMEKMMNAHWDNWINSPVPALDNKKPTEAVKSKIGREKLEALLTQFERQAEHNPMVGQTVETIKNVRTRLGL